MAASPLAVARDSAEELYNTIAHAMGSYPESVRRDLRLLLDKVQDIAKALVAIEQEMRPPVREESVRSIASTLHQHD